MTRQVEALDPRGRLYVVDKLRHLAKAAAGDRTWCCVEQAAEVGERGAVYRKRHGVVLLFTIEERDGVDPKFCSSYQMAAAEIRVDAVFDPPLTSKVMRGHSVLKRLPAVRSSFQRRSFRLDTEFTEALEDLARSQSPIG